MEDQLRFIESSAAAYDKGFESEAKRLSVAIRILCYDSRTSKSVLGQLGLLNEFYDTCLPHEQASAMTHGGLVWVSAKGSQSKYIPMLDDVPFSKMVPFSEWWETQIFCDSQKRCLSRRALITTAANQDGGAHVDPALDIIYSDLVYNNSLGLLFSDGAVSHPIHGAEKAAIRQISHEVLKTFRNGYEKKPTIDAPLVFGGMTHVEGVPPLVSGFPNPGWKPPGGWVKTGRNMPCPCGSGVKYKRCHGK